MTSSTANEKSRTENRTLRQESAKFNGERTQLNNRIQEISNQLNQSKSKAEELQKRVDETEQQKATKSSKTNKTKMEYLLKVIKDKKITIDKTDWENYLRENGAKYDMEKSKFPSFQFAKPTVI